MGVLIMIGQVVLALSILVTIHELGHYFAARAFGIRVEKFYLFFDAWDVKLFSFTKGGTEYGIGWLPLGGYVKISGMIDESMDKEQMKQPPQPYEFRSKPAWQRLIVMVAGVVMNVLLGIIIFAMMTYVNGERYTVNSSLKYGIMPSKLAQEVGFKPGDKIVSINGKELIRFEEAYNPDYFLTKGTVYTVDRNGSKLDVTLPPDFVKKITSETKADFFMPRMKNFYVDTVIAGYNADKAGLKKNDQIFGVDSIRFEYFDEFQTILQNYKGKTVQFHVLRGNDSLALKTEIDGNGKVGFKPETKDIQYEIVKFGFFASLPKGVDRATQTIALQITSWKHIFNGDVAVDKAVQGPIGIAKFFGKSWDWSNFWFWTGLISLGLAFMNILPIPALDGGHVVILLAEVITRRKPSDRFLEITQIIGMVILLSLMVLVIGNDIFKSFTN